MDCGVTPCQQLRQLIAQVGVVDAGVKLRRHGVGFERRVNGIDPGSR
jgi:hypothetical protein